VAGAAALLALEGYGAAQYRDTPQGREEERRAREEGALVYRQAREVVLRPGVLGGLVGLGVCPSGFASTCLTALQ
jgi:hypothetical protein